MPGTSSSSPLVSVAIPVYNGEATLATAIGSVLAQTYTNFDLTIVDNRSTDGTARIAAEFAQRDPRIRIVHNTEFLSVVDNHNKAFLSISDDAKYVKILDADDWFFPNCLAELVRVAEKYPTVGVVGSWVLSGTRVGADGLPYPTEYLSGRDVCRLRFLQNIRVFAGPSALLFRASVVRARQPFYESSNYHSDTEACLAVLEHSDFGYVQQVLSYMDKNEASKTMPFLARVGSFEAGEVSEITNFGRLYLTPEEYETRLKIVTNDYYAFLARAVFEFRGREFWNYHFTHLPKQGLHVSRSRLAVYAALRLIDMVGNPKRTIEALGRKLFSRVSSRRASTASRDAAVIPGPAVPARRR
jgi:glycosyltransferase involved in cell wall biosynthesis